MFTKCTLLLSGWRSVLNANQNQCFEKNQNPRISHSLWQIPLSCIFSGGVHVECTSVLLQKKAQKKSSKENPSGAERLLKLITKSSKRIITISFFAFFFFCRGTHYLLSCCFVAAYSQHNL